MTKRTTTTTDSDEQVQADPLRKGIERLRELYTALADE
jgi:hypothetical protein